MNSKQIKIKYIELPDFEIVIARIIEQTYVEEEFGTNCIVYNCYIAKNGIKLYSTDCPNFNFPSYDPKDKKLFCRGSNWQKDNEAIIIPILHWNDVKEAIEEYNRFFWSWADKEISPKEKISKYTAKFIK